MPTTADQTLLDKVAGKLRQPAPYTDGAVGSILTVSATQYGAQIDDDDVTQPTGFDPQAAALFEAVVEGAFLVANADGEFDAVERDAFKQVVLAACGESVAESQVSALLADLSDLLDEDGIDKRVKMVARTITRDEQAREVLRVAGLIAHVSAGVSEVERGVLDKLAQAFGLEDAVVEQTLADVREAIAD